MLSELERSDILDEIYEETEEYILSSVLRYSELDFESKMKEHLSDYFLELGMIQEWDDDVMDDIEDWITEIYDEIILQYRIPKRQLQEEGMVVSEDEIRDCIEKLDTFPVQKQRSIEWHQVRHELFSASNLWKLISTKGQFNSLIYDKCKPFETNKFDSYDMNMKKALLTV